MTEPVTDPTPEPREMLLSIPLYTPIPAATTLEAAIHEALLPLITTALGHAPDGHEIVKYIGIDEFGLTVKVAAT